MNLVRIFDYTSLVIHNRTVTFRLSSLDLQNSNCFVTLASNLSYNKRLIPQTRYNLLQKLDSYEDIKFLVID